ncbi:hypothetical protein FQR65_LT16263 [Abscondita terminalis]|nr:hypothetical protein FQR65_LT17268 [Abscondita terminalis]KAF5276621.1 hypothetical protein FQR65_LT16263 [Abscondita terminalis]
MDAYKIYPPPNINLHAIRSGYSNDSSRHANHENYIAHHLASSISKLRLVFCIDYQRGRCKRGVECRYVHGSNVEESTASSSGVYSNTVLNEANRTLQNKKKCKQFLKGECNRGDSCDFPHRNKNEVIKRLTCPVCLEGIRSGDLCCYELCNHVMGSMCKGFLFGNCYNNECKFKHYYLRCTRPSCNYNRCKMFHLNHKDFLLLKDNVRPFQEDILSELERVAFAYFTYLPIHQKDLFCAGKLIGGRCHRATCTACKQSNLPFAKCFKCNEDLETNKAYRLQCLHVICKICLDRLPIRCEALPFHECPACRTFQYAYELF